MIYGFNFFSNITTRKPAMRILSTKHIGASTKPVSLKYGCHTASTYHSLATKIALDFTSFHSYKLLLLFGEFLFPFRHILITGGSYQITGKTTDYFHYRINKSGSSNMF